MVLSGEVLTGLIGILGTIIAGVLYIGKRQADARLKDSESRLQDAKAEIIRAQGDAAQQTGLIETLRELVKVNQSTSLAMQALSQALQDAALKEESNYRELRKQLDANTSFINSNVLSLSARIDTLRGELVSSLERLSRLVVEAKGDQLKEMLERLEQVYELVQAMKPRPPADAALPVDTTMMGSRHG